MSYNTHDFLHRAFDREFVRRHCELLYVPSIFDSLETNENGYICVSEKYRKGKEKAEQEFKRIMSDPEAVKAIIGD